jgi:periplasmic copper chaperone A
VFSIRFSLAALLLALSVGVAAESPLSLEGAWVRALPPTQPNTAGYLTIVNSGAEAVEIVSASASVADRVEFHTTREVEGYMRMEQLATLEVAAGQSLELAPGGVHLMLLGLVAMPSPGDKVQLCLAPATGPEICTEAPVRKDAGNDAHQHHHH